MAAKRKDTAKARRKAKLKAKRRAERLEQEKNRVPSEVEIMTDEELIKKRRDLALLRTIICIALCIVMYLYMFVYSGTINFCKIFIPIIFTIATFLFWYTTDLTDAEMKELNKREEAAEEKLRTMANMATKPKVRKRRNYSKSEKQEKYIRYNNHPYYVRYMEYLNKKNANINKDFTKSLIQVFLPELLFGLIPFWCICLFWVGWQRDTAMNLLWLLFGIVVLIVVFVILYLLFNKISESTIFVAIFAAVPIALFALDLNMIIDRTEPIIKYVEVRGVETYRTASYGRNGVSHTSRKYAMIVRINDENEIFPISKSEYEKYSRGDYVKIVIHDGLYGFEWYEVPYEE